MGFEPTIPAVEWPQTLDSQTTRFNRCLTLHYPIYFPLTEFNLSLRFLFPYDIHTVLTSDFSKSLDRIAKFSIKLKAYWKSPHHWKLISEAFNCMSKKQDGFKIHLQVTVKFWQPFLKRESSKFFLRNPVKSKMQQHTHKTLWANHVEMIVSTWLALAYLTQSEFLWKRN